MTTKQISSFFSKLVYKDGRLPTKCWWWTGAKNDKGYGQLFDFPKVKYAHRLAYEHWRGPIPEGLYCDHLCFMPSCVNPFHLEPVTCSENLRRAYPTCKRGHDLSLAYVRKTGARMCKECGKMRNRIAWKRLGIRDSA